MAGRILFLCLLPALTLFAESTAAPRTWALHGGRCFDGARFVTRTLYVEGGRFVAGPIAAPDTAIDLAGRWVVPPFAEAHNHNLEVPRDLDERMQAYLGHGVFYAKMQSSIRKRVEPIRHHFNHPGGIDVAFAHAPLTARGGHPVAIRERFFDRGMFEGVFSSKAEIEGQGYFLIDSLADLEQKWPAILASRPDFIKCMVAFSEEFAKRRDDTTYFGRKGLNPAYLPAIVRRAHDAGLRVSVHVNTATDFHHAVVSGADELAHLPGLSIAGLSRIADADAARAARQGTVVVTTAALARNAMRRDPARADTLRATLLHNLAVLRRHRVTLAIGSDDFEDDSSQEAAFLDSLGVFPRAELLKMWSENAARTIFPQRRIGRLEPGYEASLLVLEGDPLADWGATGRIALRMKQGQLLRLPAVATP